MNKSNFDKQQTRRKYLKIFRDFFDEHDILEVDTPCLYKYPVTDVYLENFSINIDNEKKYFQTSPEYAMKRLLCEYKSSIYQICKAYRNDPVGKFHLPEFTMVEWYCIDFDYFDLMKQIETLFIKISPKIEIERITYQNIFEKYLAINPHIISNQELKILQKKYIGDIVGLENPSNDDILNLLFNEVIEKKLVKSNNLVFIYDYPKSQSALATISKNTDNIEVGQRFEVYYKGVELANGYNELQDVNVQYKRFLEDLRIRKTLDLPAVKIDFELLDTMKKNGLPKCSGVAMGFDRVIMSMENIEDIANIVSYYT